MKIHNVTGVTGAYQKAATRRVSKPDEVSRTSKGDGVTLSKEAQEVLALKDKLAQAPDVRAERIAQLRKEIEAGTYRPDAKAIAAKMLRTRVFDDLK